MIRTLRVIDTGLRPARWNIAVTAALIERHVDGRIADTLRFHRYRPAVLIGRHQRSAEACDVRACRRHGADVARRITGGGAVYMTPGVLAFDLVVGRGVAGDQERAASTICQALARGLSRLDAAGRLVARYRAPNDIVIAGRKVVGASGYYDGTTLAYQGAIMIDMDFAMMAEVLALPAPLDGQLTCLREHAGPAADRNALMGFVTGELTQVFGYAAAPDDLDEATMQIAERMLVDGMGDAEDDPCGRASHPMQEQAS